MKLVHEKGAKWIIPKFLYNCKNQVLGFSKLRPKSRIPAKKDWQNKPYSYTEVEKWVNAGNNYGALGGDSQKKRRKKMPKIDFSKIDDIDTDDVIDPKSKNPTIRGYLYSYEKKVSDF